MDTHISTLVELNVLKEKVEDVKYTIMMGYVQKEVMKQLNITSQSKRRAEEIIRWTDMKEQLMKLHEAKSTKTLKKIVSISKQWVKEFKVSTYQRANLVNHY